MNKKDLKPGDIIVKNDMFINKIVSIDADNLYNTISYYIDLLRSSFINCSFNNQTVKIGDKLRLATEEEKHWLNECIKASKFISKDEALKNFIPEKFAVKNVNRCLAGLLSDYKLHGNTPDYYYHFDEIGKFVSYTLLQGYTEISFEQFKKYILKLDTDEEIIDKTISIKSIQNELLKHYEKDDVNEIINIINKIK